MPENPWVTDLSGASETLLNDSYQVLSDRVMCDLWPGLDRQVSGILPESPDLGDIASSCFLRGTVNRIIF
jgi:glycerol kinase